MRDEAKPAASLDTTLCAVRIISPESAGDLADRVEAGDEDARVWATAVEGWLKRATTGKRWDCPGCHTAFKDTSEVGVFVVAIPQKEYGGREPEHGLAGVICSRCVESGKDLKQIVRETLQGRAMMPRDFN